ncbi:MAG: hypothetical protein P8Z37_19640 [Acidobacteriota bacterium]
MKTKDTGLLLNAEGKGFLGCMLGIVLLVAMIFAAIKLAPVYYSNYMFEEELKNITSDAGARYRSNDTIITEIVNSAKEFDITIKPADTDKNIKIERFAGQIHITVRYYVPVDFLIYKTTLEFEIKNSSFTAG